METVASEETDLGYTCRLSGSSPRGSSSQEAAVGEPF